MSTRPRGILTPVVTEGFQVAVVVVLTVLFEVDNGSFLSYFFSQKKHLKESLQEVVVVSRLFTSLIIFKKRIVSGAT